MKRNHITCKGTTINNGIIIYDDDESQRPNKEKKQLYSIQGRPHSINIGSTIITNLIFIKEVVSDEMMSILL